MKLTKNLQSEIDQTLKSLDNWSPIKTDAFFYTRLAVKIENIKLNKQINWFFDSPLLRPSLIALALLINIISINFFLKNNQYFKEQELDFTTAFTNEYILDQSMDSYTVFNNE